MGFWDRKFFEYAAICERYILGSFYKDFDKFEGYRIRGEGTFRIIKIKRARFGEELEVNVYEFGLPKNCLFSESIFSVIINELGTVCKNMDTLCSFY